MPRPTKDARGLAKAERERERQAKKTEKLAQRRAEREQPPEPEQAGEAPQQAPDDEDAPALGGNRLVVLAADIRAAHAGVLDAAMTRARRAIEAGHALIEAKSILKHGRWLPWLKEYCEIPERTAQLYMKLASLGLPEEFVAQVGMQAAAETKSFTSPGYNPYAHCDEEQRRQWTLFVLFGISGEHVEWLLQRQFSSPDEWLGEEGAKSRRCWRMREVPDTFRQRWAVFQEQHKDTTQEEIEAALERQNAA